MRSSFEKYRLSASEIGAYIKSHGELLEATEPCIYIPDIDENGYKFFEEDSNGSHKIKASLPFGINEKNREYLSYSVLVFVNDDSTNAIAAEIQQTPIIGIYVGSIADIDYNANLMIGTIFEKGDFPSSKFKRKKIYINNDGILAVSSEDSYLGYKDERILSYMLSEAALRFLVLHEIGHHVRGHITELTKQKQFVLLKATDRMNGRLEMEADAFAATKLAGEYDLILSGLSEHQADLDASDYEELELLALSTIVTAITLPFSILYQPDSNDIKEISESDIVVREISAVMILSTELYNNDKCKRAVIYDLNNQSQDDIQGLDKNIDIKHIKESGYIDFFDFFIYICHIYISSKRLYYQVNMIGDIDAYLEHYLNVIAQFKNEDIINTISNEDTD